MNHLNGRHCPFVKDPCDECYVADLNSRNVAPAVHFCGAHFEECEIYARLRELVPTQTGPFGVVSRQPGPKGSEANP